MKRFSYRKLNIKDLLEIKYLPISDERGFLSRIFCIEEINTFSTFKDIKQINRTFTKKKVQLEDYISSILQLVKQK